MLQQRRSSGEVPQVYMVHYANHFEPCTSRYSDAYPRFRPLTRPYLLVFIISCRHRDVGNFLSGDMTGRRPKVHGPGSHESDGEETWGSDFSRMDETRRGSPCHNTERYTHVTYCCWCINQFLQSKAVALCGRCPRIMCRICASGWDLVIPTGQRSRDILLPYWCCRCTQ